MEATSHSFVERVVEKSCGTSRKSIPTDSFFFHNLTCHREIYWIIMEGKTLWEKTCGKVVGELWLCWNGPINCTTGTKKSVSVIDVPTFQATKRQSIPYLWSPTTVVAQSLFSFFV